MTSNQNQPREFDAVLGGETPPPLQGVVLGGIEGVRRRLENTNIEIRLAALQDALNYQSEGLELIIDALENKSKKVRNCAYKILISRNEAHINEILKKYRFWSFWDLRERITETLDDEYLYSTFKVFYNLPVKKYDPEQALKNPVKKAYIINDGHFISFLRESRSNDVEALIFKGHYENVRLVNKDKLKNIKAISYGNYGDVYEILDPDGIPDIGYILKVYHQAEMLLVRGIDYDYFSNKWQDLSKLEHHYLKALIVETGGLGRDKIANILSAKFPALEHLELWLGAVNCGGNSSVEDLMPIFSGELFLNLIYLGLRNSEYTNDIAKVIVSSPIVNRLKVLDLSMGTLTNEGAKFLLNCPAINNLKILNLASNCLNDEIIKALNDLDVEVITSNQKSPEKCCCSQRYPDERYCSIYE